PRGRTRASRAERGRDATDKARRRSTQIEKSIARIEEGLRGQTLPALPGTAARAGDGRSESQACRIRRVIPACQATGVVNARSARAAAEWGYGSPPAARGPASETTLRTPP